jgi:hypothetical protein
VLILLLKGWLLHLLLILLLQGRLLMVLQLQLLLLQISGI